MSDAEERIAEILHILGRDLFRRGSVKGVVVWGGGESAAWIMDAMALRALIGDPENSEMVGLRGPRVARAINSLGIPRISGRNFEYERGLVVSDFLDRLSDAVSGPFYEEDGFTVRVTFIPEPGYPWPEPFYSRKARGVVQGERPSWLLPSNVVEKVRNVDSPGVDFCKLSGPLDDGEYGTGEVSMPFKGSNYVLTHSMGTLDDITRKGDWDSNAKSVNECGGLLFPSLSLGAVPASNFGLFALVADIGLVKRAMRDHDLAQVYDTDVWSLRTGSFQSVASVSAFDQLTGRSDWMSYFDMNVWSLGIPDAPELHGPGIATRITSMRSLKTHLDQRARDWPRSMTPEDVLEAKERFSDKPARYPYLEVKANGVMPIGSFPVAVQPVGASDGFRRFLDATGFSGVLLTVELPSEVLKAMSYDPIPGVEYEMRDAIRSWAWMQYGWEVADAIVEFGAKS